MIWCMLAFPIIHVFVGVGLVYLVLAIFLNTTIIEVGGGRITVRHGPVPWAGNCDLASGDVTQLFVKEKVFHGKRGRSVQYQLVAIDRGDRRVKLLENLDTPEIALYLEQEIESRLRIRDTPVPGEVMG